MQRINVTLNGADGERTVGITPPALVETPKTPKSTPDASHHCRSAYAAMKDLAQQFSDVSIEIDQVWAYLKDQHSVDSRAKFTTMQWVRIATELQACRRDATLFKIFVDAIPDRYFRIHVYPSDPSVCIGRPKVNLQHIAEEWGDFQDLANVNGCEVKVVQGKRTQFFKPNIDAPVPSDPSPNGEESLDDVPLQFQPDVSLVTNARGEVLNVFGDVIEKREVLSC